MVSVIIPAFDEAATIARKVAEVVRHPAVREVIVVDDGSRDATARLAADAGARVIALEGNVGKAMALHSGVMAASQDVLLFLDADVTGYTHEQLSRIIDPVLGGQVEMFVGIRARMTVWLNHLLHVFPIISGERALTRALWLAVPAGCKRGFQIEIALNYFAKRTAKGMGFALIPGTEHHIKERKYGLWAGLLRRLGMVADVLAISVRLYVIDAWSGLGARLRARWRPG
jgi:glycosyltransferase involved in cell wall biosynthesis